MIMQMREGLETLGVLAKARGHPDIFRPVFTPSNCEQMKIISDSFLDAVSVNYSADGSNHKEMEINT